MDLFNQSCLSGWLAVLHNKNFYIEHYSQTFQPIVVLPVSATLIGTISCCHFIPLPLTLTLDGYYKVSGKQNLLT